MNHWIGIVSSPSTHKRLSDKTDSHYCMPENCDIGDLVALYVTRRAYKSPGFFGLFSIHQKDSSRDAECRSYATFTRKSDCPSFIELLPIKLLKNPIGIELIKANPVLSTSIFVRKNMLGNYFQVSKREFDELLSMIHSAPQ
jgi:hypothetical protein